MEPNLVSAPAPGAAAPRVPRCPACEGHPSLEVFRRYELITAEPLRHCPRCYGFWAAKDSLARGVADGSATHAALLASQAPPRCRSCFGRLDDAEVCRKCGRSLPAYDCPGCGQPLERNRDQGVTLDHCPSCRGTWFDVGEIRAVYGLQPPPTAMRKVYGEALDAEPPSETNLILEALFIVARIFLPF